MRNLEICWECWPRVAIAILAGAALVFLLLPARVKVAA